MKNITVIFMASGLSIRFGRNKLIEKVNKKLLFQHSLDLLLEMELDQIIIVTNTKEIREYAAVNKLFVYENKNAHLGQGTTIKIGMENAKKENDYMFITGDMPNLNRHTIEEILMEFYKTNNITMPIVNNKTFNPVVYPNRYRKKLLEIPDNKTGKSIITNKESITYVNFNKEIIFKDIDFLEDLL